MEQFKRVSRPKENNEFIFGIRAVIEAIKAGRDIESIYLQRSLNGELIVELKGHLKNLDVPVHNVPVEKLNRMTQKNHQGVIAVISSITFQKIEDIIPAIYEKGETPLILILDGITDVRNMGAIARTAACTGVHAIVVPTKNSAQINADAIKTSAGALFTIPVCRHANLHKTALFLQECGLQIVACTEKTSDLIYVPDYTVPTAIVMGAEDEGISNDIMRMANHLAKIPMFGEIGSLNVSVSTGVILYEAIRQRSTNTTI
ncbi:23S rRNA (guanosine(2251)-2'-O)-methyltransferase RlmB [Pedobacter quisquiliarum]|jgi:23S rRNA (guanosine2251-2'-O)-methyltransferase|uniref:23S rRNA (Guanosine(2251)-2'-O)-methyltransferase RlmB n=1 Tax=Pedobacter quisquiliarum TaxID=1834438 RepID=A0A916UBF1_9SPHI|nr:23S rRNA (guanosine(2251)-2'-O)-methyltransferase RlmB [Pedobacter quisquiliarum]GGC67519.1 23S rRNA (guanosine(2251)-2'-O)-methyltransferase RlmB [Pedobacter quisquiliarum]